jgi:hypothetical protein
MRNSATSSSGHGCTVCSFFKTHFSGTGQGKTGAFRRVQAVEQSTICSLLFREAAREAFPRRGGRESANQQMINKIIDSISRGLAFYPPTPPSYEVAQHGDGDQELYIQPTVRCGCGTSGPPHLNRQRTKSSWPEAQTDPSPNSPHFPSAALPPPCRGLRKVPRARAYLLPRGNASIVAVYLPAPGPPVRHTLLHSHGNGVDLGQMMPLLDGLSQAVGCNVMAFDYTGIGLGM